MKTEQKAARPRKVFLHDVQRMMAQGLSSPQIAKRLNVTRKAVWNVLNPERAKTVRAIWGQKNKKKLNKQMREWRIKNAERHHQNVKRRYETYRERQRDLNLHRKFGISLAQFETMVASQNGCCAICDLKPQRTLHIDHCHHTGKIRGLLCGDCNRALGLLRDNADRADRAAIYLRQ